MRRTGDTDTAEMRPLVAKSVACRLSAPLPGKFLPLIVLGVAPAAAERDLVAAAEPGAVGQNAVVGALGLVEHVRAVPHAVRVAIAGGVEAALRRQRETVADVAGANGQEQVVAAR